MHAYSLDLRERVAAAAALPHRTQGQVAAQFGVSVSFVAKLQQRQRRSGSLAARPHSGGAAPCLSARAEKRVLAQVARCPDTTLAEIQTWLTRKGLPAASPSTLCRLLARQGWGRKKSVHASQRDTPRVRGQRRAFLEALTSEDGRCFKFVDETGTHRRYYRRYGRAQPGQRVGQGVPWRSGNNVTVVVVMTINDLEAVMELDGALNEAAFATYLDQVLGPTLQAAEVVVLDNLRGPKMAGMAERVAADGARLLFLPPYSSDFIPIELAWSKLKVALRTAQARTRQALSEALTHACNWLRKSMPKTGLRIVATMYTEVKSALDTAKTFL